MTDWQPIGTAPLDTQRVLVWNGRVVVEAQYSTHHAPEKNTVTDAWFIQIVDGAPQYNMTLENNPPTHWMPLPEPPGV